VSTPQSPLARVREYFFLKDALELSTRMGEARRTAVAKGLGVARQRAEAADALWSNGHTAEGLRMAVDAFGATLAATAPLQGEPAAPPPPAEEVPEAEAEPEDVADDGGEADAAANGGEAVDGGEADEDREAPAADASHPEETHAPAEAEAEEVAPAGTDEAPTDGQPDWSSALARRGVGASAIEELRALEQELDGVALPLLDAEVSADHGQLFHRVLAERRVVDEAIAAAGVTPRDLHWRRGLRFFYLAALCVGLVAALVYLTRTPYEARATASAEYNSEFVASRLVDGDPTTEWLLPDRRTGWIEVRLTPPRDITELRLLNGHNRQFNDRATHEFTLEVFRGADSVFQTDAEFERLDPNPTPMAFAVDENGVDRIRIEVRSWHRTSAALAELDWDERE
jgi:hypothetical protein